MNLIQWKDNQIHIAPEAYGIKAFKDIWDADKTKSKDKAIMELTTLYFLHDPRSEFMIETSEEERLNLIKVENGLPEDWQPNDRFKRAVEIYKKLTYTTSASILDGNRIAIKTIRSVIETPLGDLALSPEERLAYADKLAATVTKANKLAEEIAKAEKNIFKDVEEHSSKMRGAGKRTIGDMGLSNLF